MSGRYNPFSRLPVVAILLSLLLAACAHPITITPIQTPPRDQAHLKPLNVMYVMSDADRNKQATTDGGGGDKVSYYPYRDVEKSIRDALRAVYQEVSVSSSIPDAAANQSNQVALVFVPEIATSSVSNSVFTWPPTQFFINLTCTVYDASGKSLGQLRVSGNGAAEFSEFKLDFGLAGRRAASDLSSKLQNELRSNPLLQ